MEGWKARRNVNKSIIEFEAKGLIAEKEFTRIEKVNTVNYKPCTYAFILIAGVFSAFLSIALIMHL